MPSNENSVSSEMVLMTNSSQEAFVDSLFKLPGIRCKNPANIKRVMHKIISDGASKLQVITDFDRTLTKFWVDNSEGKSSYAVLEDGALMHKDYQIAARALRDKYYPIEIDPNMEESKKIPYMIEWWTNANKLMIQYKLNHDTLVEVVRHSDILLREHCSDLFDRLHALSIPILVLSGGLTQIIEEVFKRQARLHPNMHIVANQLSFNEQGNCNGLVGTLIHVFNKSEAAVHDSPYFSELEHRHNAILMGDMIADLHMAHGLPKEREENCLLKIGFLNVKEKEQLDRYMDAFDIVLTGDPGLELIYSLICQIV